AGFNGSFSSLADLGRLGGHGLNLGDFGRGRDVFTGNGIAFSRRLTFRLNLAGLGFCRLAIVAAATATAALAAALAAAAVARAFLAVGSCRLALRLGCRFNLGGDSLLGVDGLIGELFQILDLVRLDGRADRTGGSLALHDRIVL